MPALDLDHAHVARLRRDLMRWYQIHRRDLPWRAEPPIQPDPYAVLVSEAMLQQTQVATVIPYFQRFMVTFPTVHVLAAADEQAVLRLWQGLGYYRRARHLHAAARAVVERFGGRIPASVEDLLTLPGIGRYTAGAIASIAHGTPAPILDGNVMRVLARWFALEAAIDESTTQKQLWGLAQTLVPEDRPGDFNQALMELGALVCTPKTPSCLVCPVAASCKAQQHGMAETLPRRSPRRKPKAVTHHVLAVQRNGRFLFERRPEQGLWSAMWQMPTWEAPQPPAPDGQLRTWLHERTGLEAGPLRQCDRFAHATTHRAITFVLWHGEVRGGRLKPRTGTWRTLTNLHDLPLPNPQRRIIKALASQP